MKTKTRPPLPLYCYLSDCPSHAQNPSFGHPGVKQITHHGYYFRRSDQILLSRFYCHDCKRTFSEDRLSPCFRQRKRHLNPFIEQMLCDNTSQRRIILRLGISKRTMDRKFLFLAQRAKTEVIEDLKARIERGEKVEWVQMDELETSEHTKCKPLSVPLLVEKDTRKILGFTVASMPARGPLSEISLEKYGKRKDERPSAVAELFANVSQLIRPDAEILTDQNPKYPKWIKAAFPNVTHRTVKGRRGKADGLGELKVGGWDPLFSLNHSCAMLRANINRLNRRTWCTTKRKDRLEAHLWIYIHFHNRVLTAPPLAAHT